MSIRTRVAALLLKEEVTPGTFLAPSAATDGILIERPQMSFDITKVPTDEVSTSIFRRADIVGGVKGMIRFGGYLKGNGQAGGLPQWDLLARLASWTRTQTRTVLAGTTFALTTGGTVLTDSANGLAVLTVGTPVHVITPTQAFEAVATAASAGSTTLLAVNGAVPVNEASGGAWTIIYGVAGVAATAGSATGFTAQAPWSNVAQTYRGMPVWLSGNPATPDLAQIIDWSAARVAALSKSYGVALSASTKVGIPANVRYQMATAAAPPAASGELYMDGLRTRFTGLRARFSVRLRSGQAPRFEAQLWGLFGGRADAALPAVTYDSTRPGVWRASRFGIDRAAAGLSEFALDPGTSGVYPDNPNATEGFDVPELVDAQASGSIDPYMVSVATRDLFSKLRAGQVVILDAMVQGGAAVPGNRIGLTVPQAVLQGHEPTDRSGLAVENTPFQLDGEDPGAQLTVF